MHVDALLPQQHFILLVVMNMAGSLHQTHEDRNSILGQFLSRKLRQLSKIKPSCLVDYLDCRASRASFMVGDLHTVDIGFQDAGELA